MMVPWASDIRALQHHFIYEIHSELDGQVSLEGPLDTFKVVFVVETNRHTKNIHHIFSKNSSYGYIYLSTKVGDAIHGGSS